MKEIHAYQNDDGTYRVEIIDTILQTKIIGKHEVKEITESKTEILRASIQITCYQDENTGKIFTIEVE